MLNVYTNNSRDVMYWKEGTKILQQITECIKFKN